MRVLALLLSIFMVVSSSHADQVTKNLTSLCTSLVDSLPPSILSAKVVVIPFEDKTGNDAYGLSISEYIVVILQKKGAFLLVDRTEFKKVVEEINLSRSDYANENSSIEIGKVLAAKYILTGSIFKSFGNYSIVAKLIKTETTEIVSSATVTVIPSRLDSFTKDLLSEKNRVTSSLFRSLLVPGWGQYYSDRNVRGTISLVVGLGALGTQIGLILSSYSAHREYDDYYGLWKSGKLWDMIEQEKITWPEWEDTCDIYYDEYIDKFDRAVIGGIITGSVWILNLIDAAIAGNQSKKKFQLYFSSNFKDKIRIKCVYAF